MHATTVGVAADSTRLLAHEGAYAFYAAVAGNGASSRVCLLLVEEESGDYAAGCGGLPSTPVDVGFHGLQARLVADGYDAGTEIADSWEQLHRNLLVRGL